MPFPWSGCIKIIFTRLENPLELKLDTVGTECGNDANAKYANGLSSVRYGVISLWESVDDAQLSMNPPPDYLQVAIYFTCYHTHH